MANYLNQPTLAANFLAPAQTTIDVKGAVIDGGSGITIGLSGGGRLESTYEDCMIKDPEHYEYINLLGARLNDGFRFMNIPIITDWFGPFPKINRLPTPIVTGIPHSDGSFFDDGSGYSQATVWGEITEAAALNAGIVKMRVYGLSRALRHSDWFSIYHATAKGWRAYRYWDVIAKADGYDVDLTMAYQDYTLGIAPPLREAVAVGTRVEFARPLFVGKFKQDFTLPSVVPAFFVTKQTIQFQEAF
jgi:hypothetical protein